MVYGILVCYYESYWQRSRDEFVKILRNVDQQFEMIVVVTNPELLNKIPGAVLGDNRSWEFSGWDAGVSHVRSRVGITNDDYFIFANDTFCHHRTWTIIERLLFTRAFTSMKVNASLDLVGDINSFGEEFEILGKRGCCWVSTYLFMMSGAALRSVVSLSLDAKTLDGVTEPGSNISDNLRRHVILWLCPTNRSGWYKVGADSELRLQKAKMIYSEKYLSAFLQSYAFRLGHYHSEVMRFPLRCYRSLCNACYFFAACVRRSLDVALQFCRSRNSTE